MKRKGSSKIITPATVPTNALRNPTHTIPLFLKVMETKIAMKVTPAVPYVTGLTGLPTSPPPGNEFSKSKKKTTTTAERDHVATMKRLAGPPTLWRTLKVLFLIINPM